MIGKKGMAWIVAGTATVAVGVPAGIVIAQQVARHESLDKKMTQKWSDIENELAATFGGFDIRNDVKYNEINGNMTAGLEVDHKIKTLIGNVIGTNKDSSFFNSFEAIRQNLSDQVDQTLALWSEALNTYVGEGFEVSNGKIAKKSNAFSAVAGVSVELSADLNDATGTLKSMKATSNGDVVNVQIPFDVQLSISNGKVVANIDKSTYRAFIYGASKRTPLGQFEALVSDAKSPSNLYSIGNVITSLKDLVSANNAVSTKLANSLPLFITGVETPYNANTKNVVISETIGQAFGLKAFEKVLNLNNTWINKYEAITNSMLAQENYLVFSLKGHHDKATVDAAIKNIDAKRMTDEIHYLDTTNIFNNPSIPEEVSKIFDAVGFPENEADLVGKNMVVESEWTTSAPKHSASELDLPEWQTVDVLINAFNNKEDSKTKGLHTFTNRERYNWYREEGKVWDAIWNWNGNGTNHNPGEIIEDLVPILKDVKMDNQVSKDWLEENEFALVWNERAFNDVMNKYAIDKDPSHFEFDILNESGDVYKLVVNANGQIYQLNDATKTPLFSKSVKAEPQDHYPTAADKWYSDDYKIAYLPEANAGVTGYDFEKHAPFKLNGNTKLSFALSITNESINKTFINTTDRHAQIYGLAQNGDAIVTQEATNEGTGK